MEDIDYKNIKRMILDLHKHNKRCNCSDSNCSFCNKSFNYGIDMAVQAISKYQKSKK